MGEEICPVCQSIFALPVRYVRSAFRKEKYLLRYCMECQSFWNSPNTWPNAPRPYKYDQDEPEAFWKGHHLAVYERNLKWAEKLYEAIANKYSYGSVLEIGCGIGTALKVAAGMGKVVCGYDIDPISVDYGRSNFNLELHAECWNHKTLSMKYDLILAISVLEHFIEPLVMIDELCRYAKTNGSLLYLSVPIVGKTQWPQLMITDPADAQNPFRYCNGHFTHFSQDGLAKALAPYGCSVAWFTYAEAGWGGILCDFRRQKSDSPGLCQK